MVLWKPCRPQQLKLISLKHWRRRRIYALAFFLLALAAKYQRLFATPRWLRQPRKRYDHKFNFKTPRRDKKNRVLYIITSLSEYDNGKRKTTEGFDRFQETLVPVVSEGVISMLHAGFKVDVYLIAHYNVTRSHLLGQALPERVGLQVWEDASPLGYRLEGKQEQIKTGNNPLVIGEITRALARQHRFVIKDKFPFYDMFVSFEDDMLIKADAIVHWMNMTDELYRLRDLAPDTEKNDNYNQEWDEFHKDLNKRQLSQMIPGFIRVEALLDPSLRRRPNWEPEGLIPISSEDSPDLDPEPCCWLNASQHSASPSRPLYPDSNDLYIWETNLRALGIRKMPETSILDWVVLQRGRRTMVPDKVQQRWVQVDVTIGDYWAGRDGNFEIGYGRPDTKQFVYLNNQGGWMATRQQLWEWHTDFCQGGFLPPFDSPHFNLDGLDTRNIEYWSGGLHIFTYEHGCNLQRIISLDPDRFAAQLLYHSSNNKQRFWTGAKQVRFTNVNDFLGQLCAVRNNAKAAMARQLEALRKMQEERQ